MLSLKFKEILNLMGGKAVLSEGGEYYIIMTPEEFKKIKEKGVKSLTKKEPIDRINSDVDLWKNSEEKKNKKDTDFLESEEEIKYVC